MSVRLHSNYIEFRSAGGNYLENKQNIENTLLRYIKVIAIAADPNAEKNEYAKKLYKLLTLNQISNDKNSIYWFAKYSAGEITLRRLKSRIEDIRYNRSYK
jgi:hypothetical protein